MGSNGLRSVACFANDPLAHFHIIHADNSANQKVEDSMLTAGSQSFLILLFNLFLSVLQVGRVVGRVVG